MRRDLLGVGSFRHMPRTAWQRWAGLASLGIWTQHMGPGWGPPGTGWSLRVAAPGLCLLHPSLLFGAQT